MRVSLLILGNLLPIIFCGPAIAIDDNQSSVVHVVNQFCDFEFHGAQDVNRRKELVFFSEEYTEKATKIMKGMSPYVFEWQSAPLYVVDAYHITATSTSENQANAEVEYEILAQRYTWGGAIKRTNKHTDSIELQLKKADGIWRIVDPAQPHVSNTFLSASYRQLFELPATWYQNAGKAQLLWLRSAIDNILLLDVGD